MANSSTSVSWSPPPGRHAVNIGPSLGKALKARKLKASPATTGTTKRSTLPERDFYSFRFNFKPPSIDTTKPASIEIQKSAENIKVSAEYPSTQSGEGHIFLGVEQPAKEVDCVLIYDEDTGTYSLEKLDSFVNLHYDRKTAISRAPSPIPKAAPPTQKTTKGKGKREIIDDLEREIMGLDEDAEGDNDIGIEEVISKKPIARKEEEEEEEEEEAKPPKPALLPKAQPPPPPKARPVKPIPKPRAEAKAPVAAPQASRQKPSPPSPLNAVPAPPIPHPKPRAVQKKEPAQIGESVQQKEPPQQTGLVPKTQKKPQKKEPIQRTEPIQKKEKKAKPIPAIPTTVPKPALYADEEVIEFSRPPKRPRPSTPQQSLLPPTPPVVTLALPGGSNSFAPPPPPPGSHNSRGTGNPSRNVPPAVPTALSLPTSVPASPPMMGQYESDEEEWDEVSTANLASASLGPSKLNSNVDDNATAYELALEQDIFGDVFEEVDGNDEGQATTQQYVDGDGEEEEIDMNAFEEELNAHMAVEGDDSDDELAVEPDLRGGTGQPISLNRLASGGVGAEMSDDEYSSSDDSDDD